MFINTHVTNNGLLPVSENGEPFNFRGFNTATTTTFEISCPAYDTTIYPSQDTKTFQSTYGYGYSSDEVNTASSLLAINPNISDGGRPNGTAANPTGPLRSLEDEEKRRRNTLASARFRQKKKHRDETLEKENKILKEQKAELAAKFAQLEMEYKMLRQLITGKVTSDNSDKPTDEGDNFRSGAAPHGQQAIRPKPLDHEKEFGILQLNVMPPSRH